MPPTQSNESRKARAPVPEGPNLPGEAGMSVEPRGTLATRGAIPITDRQREIAVLIARGLRNREIAARLVIAQGTVTNHVHRIMARLGCRSRAQIAAWAARQGLLGEEAGSQAR